MPANLLVELRVSYRILKADSSQSLKALNYNGAKGCRTHGLQKNGYGLLLDPGCDEVSDDVVQESPYCFVVYGRVLQELCCSPVSTSQIVAGH